MQLIVEVPIQGDTWRYFTLSDAHAVLRQGTTTLALLPKASKVVAVLPAAQMSWHKVMLPKVPNAKMRAMLDGILEERLLDEPTAMHFAIHPNGDDQVFWVAACNKAWLQNALRALQAFGLSASRVIAEAEPSSQVAAHAILGSNGAQLVVSGPDGVTVWPVPDPSTRSAGWLASMGFQIAEPLAAEPQVAAALEALTDTHVQVRTRVERLAQLLQPSTPTINLAQFDLKALTGSGWQQKLQNGLLALWGAPQWRAARTGLVGLALVNLVGINALAFRQAEGLTAKRVQIEAVLKQAFPATAVVLDAPLQMDRELTQLKQSQGSLSERDFESLLGTISTVVQSSSAPTGIDFDSKELKIIGLQISPENLSDASQQLANRGLGLRVDGAGIALGLANGANRSGPSSANRRGLP